MTIILVGNKVDLDHEREVSTEEGLAFAKKNELMFFETSSKTAHNVEKSFIQMTEYIVGNIDKGEYDLSNEVRIDLIGRALVSNKATHSHHSKSLGWNQRKAQLVIKRK